MVAENVVTGGAFPWDSLLVVLLIVGAAWYVGRRINAMKRPVCNGGCAGCHGARRGRGCAFPNGPGNRRDVR
ncbi:FeoB-associated Cys-rich membrane protein [uncultured Bilophila sp.]|uniref:FeoB-associated Cys-rich membrane protein n=1 Tax=uncultured Bilophila sp. TaxID=529385 RepID=UPI0025E11773|nr:FeoB-associated Cys-rich membrane protein [uncultured Bilophila sp.]